MNTRSTILGITALTLLSALLSNAAAQETPSTVPAAYTYLPEAIHDQLAGVMRAEAPLHKVTTRTTGQGTTVVLELPPASLADEFVNASDDTAGLAEPGAAPEETASAAPESGLVLIQVNPHDGSIDIVGPQGQLRQIK